MMGIDDKLAVLKLVSMVKGESISMLVALSNIRNKKAITPNIAVDKCPNKKLKCSFGLIIMVIKEFRIGLAKPAGDAPFGYKCDFHIYIVIRKCKKNKE